MGRSQTLTKHLGTQVSPMNSRLSQAKGFCEGASSGAIRIREWQDRISHAPLQSEVTHHQYRWLSGDVPQDLTAGFI